MCPLVRWVGSKTVSKRVATSTAAKKADYIPPGTIESKVDQSVVSAAGSREDSFDEDRLITRIVQGNRGTHVKTKRGLKSPACRKEHLTQLNILKFGRTLYCSTSLFRNTCLSKN